MRNTFLILIGLSLIIISQQASAETTPRDECARAVTDVGSALSKITEHCTGAGHGADLNGCGESAENCANLAFNAEACKETTTYDKSSCRRIIKIEGETLDSTAFKNLGEKCAAAATEAIRQADTGLDDVRDRLRDARNDLADANSNSAQNSNGLMDAMKSIQDAQNQANQQKLDAAKSRDEAIAAAQDKRRQALDAADDADLEIMKEQAKIRADAAKSAVELSNNMAKIKITCFESAEQQMAAQRQLRAGATVKKSLKRKSLGQLAGDNSRFEGRFEEFKNDCYSSEKTAEMIKQLEFANNAAVVAAEEQMMITNQAKAKAARRLAGEELMAAEAIQRANVNYNMAVQQADMASQQARQQGMISALSGMMGPGGGGVPGVTGGENNNNQAVTDARNRVESLREEETQSVCIKKCAAVLGGRNTRTTASDEALTPGQHLAKARGAFSEFQSACQNATNNCTAPKTPPTACSQYKVENGVFRSTRQ